MLTHTFLHIKGIGPLTERRLWLCGVPTWEHALALPQPPSGFSPSRWALICDMLHDSMSSLAAGDHRFFASRLSPRHHWRALPEFRRRVAYLDIETDGLNAWNTVTVVGLYDGRRTYAFVAGDNLDQFPEHVQDYGLLVTFNGAAFDLPFLQRRFGPIFDHLHIDLRHAFRNLGLRGGLKEIERQLGLVRDPAIAGLCGEDAMRLWHEYQHGSAEALELLLAYNRADVEHLEPLLDIAYRELWQRAVQGTEA